MYQIVQTAHSHLNSFLKIGLSLALVLGISSFLQAQMTYSAEIEHVTCADLADGIVTLSVEGGSGTYQAYWSELDDFGLTQSDLPAGTYFVTITDIMTTESIVNQEIVVTQPEKLVIEILDISQASFAGTCDAHATLEVSGGVAPYTVEWNDGNPVGDGTFVEGLCAGVATATVKDANDCEAVLGVTVSEIGQPTAVGFNVVDVSCPGGSDGQITVNVAGGSGQYEVVWNDQSTASDIRYELSAGTYYAIVNDISTGQINELVVEVNEPEPITAYVDVTTMPSADDSCDGSLQVNIAGGTAPYSIDWLGQDPSALCYGTYDIAVTDANSCEEIVSVTLGQTTGIADIAENKWNVFPNPVRTNGTVNIDLAQLDAAQQITLIDLYGKTIQRTTVVDQTTVQINLENLSPGIYFVNVQTSENQVGVKKIVIK